jgi:hypothetical protein
MKMEQNNSKEFYQSAMRLGTYLGIFWAMTYILLFKFPTNAMVSTIAMAMYMGSPFLAGRMVATYRKRECSDCLKYPQAWTLLFCMYICATLLSTMTNYIFFGIIDQGAFLMEFDGILSQLISTPGIDEVTKMQFEQIKELLSQMTVKEIVWQLMNNNIFNSLTLPPMIALFVRKTL